jgi:hypothetical protein
LDEVFDTSILKTGRFPPLPAFSPLGISTHNGPHLAAIAKRFSAMEAR